VNRRGFLVGAASLALVPDALSRMAGGTPTALVTADLESHVVAIELSTGRRLREIATLPGPRSIESVGNVAVVGHTTEGAVSLIDGATLRVRRVLSGFGEPRYAFAVPRTPYALLTDSARGELVVLDVLDARIAARVALGGPARHLSYDPVRRLAWTSLGNKAARVAVVDLRDPRRPRVSRRFSPPFLAHDVGLSGSGRRWVTSGAERRLAIYEGRQRIAVLPAHAPPQHVTFLGGLAFVTSGDDGTLRVHEPRTGRLLRTTRIPFGSYNVQHGWGMLLVPSLSLGTLCVIDRRGRVVRQVRAARSSHDASFVVSA
jgi:hypothetical protein